MTGDLEKIIEANRGMCICDSCPTYNECMRSDKKGCLCPPCPVTKALGLKKAYYCIKGSEKEQH